MENLLSEILFDASLLFIVIGSGIALLFGLGLIFASEQTLRLNNQISTRFSMRKATKPIETPIKIESWFYRHAKITGAVISLGAIYVLHYLLFEFSVTQLLPYMPRTVPIHVWEWLFQAGNVFFLITCSAILLFGLVVLIRPSQLKRFEEKANYWISTRKAFKGMNSDIDHANRLVNRHPRAFGIVVVLLALRVLISLAPKIW